MIQHVNIRDFAHDRHKSVDDRPFGGGVGMILRVDVLHSAIQFTKKQFFNYHKKPYREKVILLDPTGTLFTQKKALAYSQLDHLILICGHYEGYDARIQHFVDEAISIGRYILTGGEIPALVLVDSITRLVPGVLSATATTTESYSDKHTIEPPAYTKPRIYKGHAVPSVLLSGNHAQIAFWRTSQAITRSKELLKKRG